MLFFFNDTATTEIYTLSLHDALPILSSNSSSPRNDEPRSRKPFSSPLLFFISPPILPPLLSSASHQFIDDANQFIFAAVADVNDSSAPPAVNFNFCP